MTVAAFRTAREQRLIEKYSHYACLANDWRRQRENHVRAEKRRMAVILKRGDRRYIWDKATSYAFHDEGFRTTFLRRMMEEARDHGKLADPPRFKVDPQTVHWIAQTVLRRTVVGAYLKERGLKWKDWNAPGEAVKTAFALEHNDIYQELKHVPPA